MHPRRCTKPCPRAPHTRDTSPPVVPTCRGRVCLCAPRCLEVGGTDGERVVPTLLVSSCTPTQPCTRTACLRAGRQPISGATPGAPRCATPRGCQGPRAAWPRLHGPLPRPRPPRDGFLQRREHRKAHCSRGRERFLPPPLARGSASPHTCEGTRHRVSHRAPRPHRGGGTAATRKARGGAGSGAVSVPVPTRAGWCPLTSAGAALARDGLPADPARLHLLEARHLEGVRRGGLQVLGLGGTHGDTSASWGDPRSLALPQLPSG